MPRWADFERLAHKIMAELLPHAAVKWNDWIWGHESQAKRQIDVSIRAKLAGHPVLVVVQAKDRGAPAGR